MHTPLSAEAAAAVQDCTAPGDDRVAILQLKEARNEEFISLMFRDLIPKFREAVQENNGEAVGLKLKFYGCSDVGKPIIRISGKRFVRYLV